MHVIEMAYNEIFGAYETNSDKQRILENEEKVHTPLIAKNYVDETNSDKQKAVQDAIAIEEMKTADSVQERIRKIELEIEDGWIYMHGQREPKSLYQSKMNLAKTSMMGEGMRYAAEQFKEIVESGDYKNMMGPEYQVSYVLGLLKKYMRPNDSRIVSCQNILDSFKK